MGGGFCTNMIETWYCCPSISRWNQYRFPECLALKRFTIFIPSWLLHLVCSVECTPRHVSARCIASSSEGYSASSFLDILSTGSSVHPILPASIPPGGFRELSSDIPMIISRTVERIV